VGVAYREQVGVLALALGDPLAGSPEKSDQLTVVNGGDVVVRETPRRDRLHAERGQAVEDGRHPPGRFQVAPVANVVLLVTRGTAPEARPVFLALFAATGAILVALAVAGTRGGRGFLIGLGRRFGAERPLEKLGEAAGAYRGRAGLLAVNLLLALFENLFPLTIQVAAAIALVASPLPFAIRRWM